VGEDESNLLGLQGRCQRICCLERDLKIKLEFVRKSCSWEEYSEEQRMHKVVAPRSSMVVCGYQQLVGKAWKEVSCALWLMR
jgi:hypothetical protein